MSGGFKRSGLFGLIGVVVVAVALAVKPIDDAAIEARGSMWDSARRSQHLGWVVALLIFTAR